MRSRPSRLNPGQVKALVMVVQKLCVGPCLQKQCKSVEIVTRSGAIESIPSKTAATASRCEWRLDVNAAGSGVLGDLLAHCIDTAMWLNGGIQSVTGMTETFIKERKHTLTGKVEKVGIDDACAFLCRFDNGSLGLFESTRYARGHKALYTFEINGEHGSIRWDLHDLHRLEFFDHKDEGATRGWRSIHVTDPDHPYMKHWWVPGLQIGYEHSFVHQVADFLTGLATGVPTEPTFRTALGPAMVCDAVQASAASGQWVDVNPVSL